MQTSESTPAQRVLIAEDDRTASAICARALTNAGYEVSAAFDGAAALSMLRDGVFDLVVADMVMPTMDGLELVRAMRADARLTRLPVLVLTSCSEETMRKEGFRAGCDHYLVKPVRPSELVESVSKLLSSASDTGERLSGAIFSGRLDGTSVASVLAFLRGQQRSGMLRLARFGAQGEIALRNGRPLTATLVGSLQGNDALSALLGWNAGTFRFERHDVSDIEPELTSGIEELLAEPAKAVP